MIFDKKKVCVIAEAGINHNGSIKDAIRLIKVAKITKADFIKFQIFKSENVATEYAKKSSYQKKNLKDSESQLQMIRKYELKYSLFKKIKNECKKNKINFLCSPFDIESLNYLKSIGEKIIKIPSGEITNYPLLREIGKMKKTVILSSGMSNLIEIDNAIKVLTKFGTKKKNISVLHCITSYPAPFNQLGLNAIRQIKDKFRVNVGFSDHSQGTEASIAAVALGAKIIEKHLTLSRKLNGPDHKSSLGPTEFTAMVSAIRNIEKAIKKENKSIKRCELENLEIARKSIVAKKNIMRGEIFSDKNLTTKRPALGLNPMKWTKVIGKKAKKNYLKNDFI